MDTPCTSPRTTSPSDSKPPEPSPANGNTEHCHTGDVFHWPAGHTLLVNADAEIILVNPQDSHGAAMDHIAKKLAG